MLMIIACHFVSNIYPIKNHVAVNDVFIALYFPGGQVGVALFFLLNGFFGAQSPLRPRKIVKIVGELFFYAWLSLIVYAVATHFKLYDFPRLSKAELNECLVDALIPYSSGTWWFITAYIPLQLVKKPINAGLSKLTRGGFLILLFALWFFWYSIANGYKGILSYFTFEKALFFYATGFFIQKEIEPSGSLFFSKPASLFLGLLSYLGASALQILYTSNVHLPFPKIFLYAAQGSVCVTLASFFLFIFFSRLHLPEKRAINAIATTTLGVYIFHRSNIMAHLFFRKVFDGTAMYEKAHFPLWLTLGIISIFAICAAVDALRAKTLEGAFMRISAKCIEKAKSAFIK